MPSFTLVRTAAAPAETVFDVLTDHRGYPSFTPLRKVVLEQEGAPDPDGIGAIRRLHAVGPPMREEVLEYDRPHRMSYRLLSGAPVRDHVGTVVLTPYGEGTQVVYTIDTTPTLPLSTPVTMGIMRVAIGQLLSGVVGEAERRAGAGA
ncbi:MAG TPA: SRPBCC family protein [Thermoleophilaceae bacterium]